MSRMPIREGGTLLAEVEKFNDSGVMMLLKHSDRLLKNDSNKDIIQEKSDLNYSIGLQRQEHNPKQLYKKMKDKSYLYGRGSQRESSAITCCSWVITLPKSISDYSAVEKDEITVLNPDAEKAFSPVSINLSLSDMEPAFITGSITMKADNPIFMFTSFHRQRLTTTLSTSKL